MEQRMDAIYERKAPDGFFSESLCMYVCGETYVIRAKLKVVEWHHMPALLKYLWKLILKETFQRNLILIIVIKVILTIIC